MRNHFCATCLLFCTQLFTEKHVHFTTSDDVMKLILFKFLYCSFNDKKNKTKKKNIKCSKNLNNFFFIYTKCLSVQLQPKNICCRSSSRASIYEPPHDKTNKMTLRPTKTQISLGIRSVWSESSLASIG